MELQYVLTVKRRRNDSRTYHIFRIRCANVLTMGATMSSLDNAILCCGRSWSGECQICEEQAYKDYKQEMRDEWDWDTDTDGDDNDD